MSGEDIPIDEAAAAVRIPRIKPPTLEAFSWIDWQCPFVYPPSEGKPDGTPCGADLHIGSSDRYGLRWNCPRAAYTEAGERDYSSGTFGPHMDASYRYGAEPPGWAKALLALARKQAREIHRLKRRVASLKGLS